MTVTPSGATRPTCHVSAATARFAQLYAPASAGRHPDPDVTPRIRPCPAAAMIGSAARQHVEVPVEMDLEHGAPVVLETGGEAGESDDARDVDDRVKCAELGHELGKQCLDRGLVGDRDTRRAGTSAGVDDSAGGRALRSAALRRSVQRDPRVDGDDEPALATELFGDRGADPRGTAGDDGDTGRTARAHDRLAARSTSSPAKSPCSRHVASRS